MVIYWRRKGTLYDIVLRVYKWERNHDVDSDPLPQSFHNGIGNLKKKKKGTTHFTKHTGAKLFIAS